MTRQRYIVIAGHGGFKVIDVIKVRMGRLRSRVFAWARIINEASKKGNKMAMYTLTYDTLGTLVDAAEWEPNHIGDFVRRLHWRMGERLLAYAWVAEMQMRGVVHYHMIVVYRGYLPYPDKGYMGKRGRTYKRLWEWGSSRTDVRVRSPFYICTYVGKEYQKDFSSFPDRAHAWSVWFSDKVLKDALRFQSLDELAQMLVNLYGWDVGLYEYRELKGAASAERGWGYVGSYVTLGLAHLMAGCQEKEVGLAYL